MNTQWKPYFVVDPASRGYINSLYKPVLKASTQTPARIKCNERPDYKRRPFLEREPRGSYLVRI